MARVTIKSLQEQLKKSDDIIKWQFNKIQELQEQNDNILNNKDAISIKDYEALEKQFKSLQEDYKELKKLYEHKKEKKHNERGAGRKSKITEEQIKYILELRQQGMSYNDISKKVSLSKGYVYKLINEQQ